MKSKVYLDNAAATGLSKTAYKAIKPFLEGFFANPSSLHESGLKARQAIEQARAEVAAILKARPQEIIWTSGGTESVNLAIQGTAKAYAKRHGQPGHIIVSAIEHEAVLECVKALQSYGWKIDYLSVDKSGKVNPEEVKKLVRTNTALVSVMYANNEVGTIQPIPEIGSVISAINRSRLQKKLGPVVFHTDACQAGGSLELDTTKLKVDMLTLNGSKINGPKGSGILFVKSGTPLEPLIYGGGQERGLRSGTENTPAIVGFAVALKEAQQSRTSNVKKLWALQNYLESKLSKIKGVQINGPRNSKLAVKDFNFGLDKLPGTINFSVNDTEGEALMLYLDAAGFVVATGSACTTGSTDPSHVLIAMGIDAQLARSTIRISLGYNITKQQLTKFIDALTKTIVMLRKTSQQL